MILLDTNVLIYASDNSSPFHAWALEIIAESVSEGKAVINAVCLAELCVGEVEVEAVADRIRQWGITISDVPAAAAVPCALAYRKFRERRWSESGKQSPPMPLPDFFIGAHAMIMGWEVATADRGRFSSYFPTVPLRTPS